MRTISLILLCILCVTGITKAQTVNRYVKGSYCDTLGNTYTGYLRLKVPTNGILDFTHTHITFQTTEAAPEKEVSLAEIKTFTMAADSFVISHNEKLKKVPILKILLNTPIKLYYSDFYGRTTSILTNTGSIYVFGPDPDNLALITRKNFKEAMSLVMQAKPNVVANIQNGNFTYGYMDDLIKYYKVR